MRVLCVAEKPSIAKSITQILSGGQFTTHNTQTNYIKNYEFDYPHTRSFFTVTAVSGHLTAYDFYETHRKWTSCEPFSLFDAPVEVQTASDKKSIEQNLLTQARRSDMLMIWTDCDREGEHIGMEIARVCRKAKPNIHIKRARFSAIIAQQIHRAAQDPVELDRRQADAVDARILLDLKVGAAFTRMQTLALQGQVKEIADEKSIVSYGPCQFPTLGFVVQRYNHVKAFQPEMFWYIHLTTMRQSASQGGAEEIRFNWKRCHLFQKSAVMEILRIMMREPVAKVVRVTNKNTKKWKPLPLTTVELQKAASRLLKLAPKKALDIAEKLYQQGFVSYPRTETDQFDPQFDHMSLIAKQTADPVWGGFAASLRDGGYMTPRKGKNDDKAHPPIHPTAHANNLNGDEKRVYEYITRRYLACCSKDAEGSQTTVDIVCGGEEFQVTGLIIKERNYLTVFIYDKWTEHSLPEFVEGEEFEPTTCEIRHGETSKPNFLTEADLVTLMDKNGIGTDATIAQHIQTIIDRSYVIERMEGATKYLVPSTLGIGLIEGYNQIGLAKSVTKPLLRRETERRMVRICEGTTTKQEMLEQSLEQYKEMFIMVKREFNRVKTSVQHYLARQHLGNGGDGGNGGGGGGGGGPGGGGGGGRDNNSGGDGNDPPAGSRGRGKGRGRGRGTTSEQPTVPRSRGTSRGRGRGRGSRGAAPNAADIIMIDDSDPDLPSAKPPSRAGRLSSLGSGTAFATPRTQGHATDPLTISSDWRARITSSVPTLNADAPIASGSTKTWLPVIPDCDCGVPAIRKTINQGNAKGKAYWKCPIEEDGCSFFEYVAEAHAVPFTPLASSRTVNVPTKRPHSFTQENEEPPGQILTRQCLCKEDAAIHTVFKDGPNQGRKFWKCTKGDGLACKFWEWDDEAPRSYGGPSGDAMARSVSNGSSTPYSTASGSGSDVCFKCQKSGHWAKDCPTETSNKRSRSFGTTGASNNPSVVDAECFKCHQIGHFSSACPNGTSSTYGSGKQKSFATAGGASATDECFKCGQTGHWSSNCKGSSSSNFSKKRTSSSSANTSGTAKRGRGGSKRGGGRGKKKSAFGAADDW